MEQGAVSDNDIALERREAQRLTLLGARTPTAAILGNGDIAVGALADVRQSSAKVRRSAPSWRRPQVGFTRLAHFDEPISGKPEIGALHPLI